VLQSRLLTLIVVLSLGACTAVNSPKPAMQSSPTDVGHIPNMASVVQKGADAMRLVNEKNWPEAQVALQAVIQDKNFRRLPEDIQYQTLQRAGLVAAEHGELPRGYEYFVRVTAFPEAGHDDWRNRLQAAAKLGNLVDTLSALTLIMQRWPEEASRLNPDKIRLTLRELERLPHGATLPLLQALYAAHWKLRWHIEPSENWRDLSLQLLEKGRLSEANDVAGHVTDVYVLIAMRADRRFDPVVAANPEHFDIEAAGERELQFLQSASDSAPRSLELKSDVIEALLRRQHYEAALAASDSVLSDIRSTNYPRKLFEDYDDQNSSFLNFRADALERVGRWDDAVAQLKVASLLRVGNDRYISQLIDLGWLYSELGRPNDALTTVGDAEGHTSAYGTMQIESVRLDAAAQLGAAKQIESSLQYLRSHRADAPDAFQEALIGLNESDQAAQLLIARLLDPDQRQAALQGIQAYSPRPEPQRSMDLDARWRAIIARPKVQAAIRKVGRVESYRLEEP
jgi:tetratricopeptide (TPR) repeat protein